MHQSKKSLGVLSIDKKHISGGLFSKSKRFDYEEAKFKELTPGPGHYRINEINQSLTRFFSKEERRYNIPKNWTPGPAEYMPKMYTKKSPITLGKVFN